MGLCHNQLINAGIACIKHTVASITGYAAQLTERKVMLAGAYTLRVLAVVLLLQLAASDDRMFASDLSSDSILVVRVMLTGICVLAFFAPNITSYLYNKWQ